MSNIKIHLLGATGSIGTSTLAVLDHFKEIRFSKYCIHSLTANRNTELLMKIASQYTPRAIASVSGVSTNNSFLKEYLGSDSVQNLIINEVSSGDMVLNALVGSSGIRPTLASLDAGADIALANKETLVAAGELIISKEKISKGKIIPVDSEHASAFRILESNQHGNISRLMLTASGGPFFGTPPSEVTNVSIEDVLKHPTWKMGKKISVDSATMMNKAFEIIEAYWLFGLSPECLEVIIHPTSLLHAMVQYEDGFLMGIFSEPDMKIPIQQALSWPEILPSPSKKINFRKEKLISLTSVSRDQHPAVEMAFKVLEAGGTSGAILNAANEVAVDAFLNGKIDFSSILKVSQMALENITIESADTLKAIDKASQSAKIYALELVNDFSKKKVSIK